MRDLTRDFLDAIAAACMAREGKRHGDEITFICPSHDDANPSAGYNITKHCWHCHACGAGGGALDLAKRLGVPVPSAPDTPGQKPPRVLRTFRYEIRGVDGALVAVHVRQDLDGSKKRMWWERDGSRGLGGLPVADLPLFGAELLKDVPPGSLVIVCEGEKAALGARSRGFVALGSVTGAKETPAAAVLAVLDGLDVVLWPDADDVGGKHMDRIAARLKVPPRILTWPEAPDGGDAADLVERGATREDIERLVAAAAPWTPTPDAVDGGAEEDPDPDPDEETEKSDNRRVKESKVLVDSIRNEMRAKLWHTPDGTPYASVPLAGHEEHVPVGGSDFRRLVGLAFYQKRNRVPGRNAFDEALHVVGAIAAFEGLEHDVNVRIARTAGSVWLDLADANRNVVEITATGWRVVADMDLPVKFRRPPGCLPLPVPVAGGKVALLRPLLNISDEDDFRLVVGWLVGVLHPTGPYGVLAVAGEQGSAKSTTCRILVSLVDPKDAPLRRPPKEDRDLFIAATNGHVVAFNNLSKITPGLSDALASLATEAGFVTRELYANDRERRFTERRPVLLNGIPTDVVNRGDLADRAIRVVLPPIADKDRRTEAEVLAGFQKVRPLVLGALLDAASCAMRRVDEVDIELPRSADAARWVTAAEPALGWEHGAYVRLYRDVRQEMAGSMLDGDRLADALVRFAAARVEWTGTSGALLSALADQEGVKDGKVPVGWPSTPRGLSGALDRMAPLFRRQGVTVERLRRQGKDRVRPWHVRKVGNEPSAPSADGSAGGVSADGRPADGPQPPADRPPKSPDGRREADGRTERTVESDPVLRFDFGANGTGEEDPPPRGKCSGCGAELAADRWAGRCWTCATGGVGRASEGRAR